MYQTFQYRIHFSSSAVICGVATITPFAKNAHQYKLTPGSHLGLHLIIFQCQHLILTSYGEIICLCLWGRVYTNRTANTGLVPLMHVLCVNPASSPEYKMLIKILNSCRLYTHDYKPKHRINLTIMFCPRVGVWTF